VVRDKEELPDAPVLVIANHVTAYDGALILYALPAKLRRRVAAAMSGEMLDDMRRARNQANTVANFCGPAAYWLLTALFNVFPLPRARGFRRSFAHAGEAMDRGYSVLIFPEGTRSRDGRMHAFRPGIGLLAAQSRVPIVPIALAGLGEIRATHARWFRSGKIEVRIGHAIDAANEETDPAEFTSMLEEAVRGLYVIQPAIET
jgi:long-chain acyl-CoA synthetase